MHYIPYQCIWKQRSYLRKKTRKKEKKQNQVSVVLLGVLAFCIKPHSHPSFIIYLACIQYPFIVVVVVLLFYVHDKHLRSCRDGQLT